MSLSTEDMDRIQANNIAYEKRRIEEIQAGPRTFLRKKLWCDVYLHTLAEIGRGRHYSASQWADSAVLEFDKRFPKRGA